MGQRRENGSSEPHDVRIRELGRAYAAVLLAGDELAAELVIRDAVGAGLSTAEIDDEIIAPAALVRR